MYTMDDYSKISSFIYNLGFNTNLKLNVRLDRPDKDKKRLGFYNEFRYRTDKYLDKSHMNSISIITDSYLSIEQKTKDGNSFVMIRDYNMMYIRQQFNEAVNWVNNNVFALDRKQKLTIIAGNYNPINIPLSENQYMKLEPVVIVSEDQLQMPGVRLYISSDIYYVDMNMNKFMGLVYNLNNIYIYGAGMELLNLFGRPQLGTNMHNFSSVPDFSDKIEDVPEGGAVIRTGIQKKKSKDVFEQLLDED